jgi:DNA-binding SARP family transcriptional activator
MSTAGRRSGSQSGLAAHHEAIAAARQLIRLNNLNEDAHRRLMRILDAAGQRGVALQQFKDLAKLLKEELGVTPDAASVALATSSVAIAGPRSRTRPSCRTSAPVAPPRRHCLGAGRIGQT